MLVGSKLEKCLSLQFNEVGANKEEEEEVMFFRQIALFLRLFRF